MELFLATRTLKTHFGARPPTTPPIVLLTIKRPNGGLLHQATKEDYPHNSS